MKIDLSRFFSVITDSVLSLSAELKSLIISLPLGGGSKKYAPYHFDLFARF